MMRRLCFAFILSTGLLSADEADDYYEATLYEKAIPLFASHLEEEPSDSIIRYKLAVSYRETGRLAEAINELKKAIKDSDDQLFRLESLYLLGLLCKQTEEYAEGIHALEQYMEIPSSHACRSYSEALLQLGILYYLTEDLEKAAGKLTLASAKPSKMACYTLARIYLAKICIANQNLSQAEELLLDLKQFSQSDPLVFEIDYLLGQIYFSKGDFAKAAASLEKAMPARNLHQADWAADVLGLLGSCYISEAETSDDADRGALLLDKAEACFRKSLSLDSTDSSKLQLADFLARSNKLKKNAKAKAELLDMLTDGNFLADSSSKLQAIIILSQVFDSFEERQDLFEKLISEKMHSEPNYPKACRQWGLSDLDLARRLKQASSIDAEKAYKRAAQAFAQAHESFLNANNRKEAGQALLYGAQALAEAGGNENLLKAYSLLECLTSKIEFVQACEEPDRAFYTKALIASQLTPGETDSDLFQSAKYSLAYSLEAYPDGRFAPDNLHLLATFFYREKNYQEALLMFSKLAEAFPSSPLAPSSLFWAADCSEKIRNSREESKKLLARLLDAYPDSSLAAESYFKMYSFQEYLNGTRAAIKHLESMKTRFPKTPFLVVSHYLIGLDFERDRKTPEGKWLRKKNPHEAIDNFLLSQNIFRELLQENLIPEDKMDYFAEVYYRCGLERALQNISMADESKGAKKQIHLEYAEEILKGMKAEFSSQSHPMAGLLAKGEAFPHMLEECLYRLSQVYIKGGNCKEACGTLSMMLDNYKEAKITRGYFLSRCYYQLAQIKMSESSYSEAIEHLTKAEDAAKGGFLNSEQKLDVWLLQSQCYRELDDMDKAMLLLSKVINDDAISILRLKAMYLRAELYQKQGRHDLARRQLEATSSKNGEWALKAKEKLDTDYGYR